MKFSYNWLRELVPDLATEPASLERLITTKTAECEGIEPAGAYFADVVAVRVISVEPLPKGKNKSVLISTGTGEEVRVVCGAPNVRAGMLAAWVPPGTSLRGKTIGRAVIEGIDSEGMLASAAELGINRDDAGLLEIGGSTPGEPLSGLKPDWIIEIDNKSLTHRPDLWGHIGMAREVAAITGNELQDPVDMTLLPPGAPPVKVVIADYGLCERYSALCLDNVRVDASPLWLQARLESIGLNAINNIVDVTNTVLAELPQPMHAFDRDKLSGDTIYVRPARAGERLHALNGETYDLVEADLVIADDAGPIALAGVIGGADSAISATTSRIVFESANFDATTVRLTSARHKLRTDASMRFEKSLDPENTLRGLARALGFMRAMSIEAVTVSGVADSRGPVRVPDPIALPLSFVTRKLGKQLTEAEISGILHALGFGVAQTSPGLLTVTVPSWRATKDISLKDDLVEEIGRMVGYGEIVPVAPRVASTVPPANPMRRYLRKVRRAAADQGFSEVYNYSFVTAEEVARFGLKIESHLEVRNPIASELTHLRRSLLPGLFKNIVDNVRHFPEFRLFEIGSEIRPQPGDVLPDEIPHLAAVTYDAQATEQTFFEMKRVAECVLPGAALTAAKETAVYEHPSRTAVIHYAGIAVGRLFELHPSLLADEGIEGRAVLFDIDLRRCLELSSQHQTQYTAPRRYPTSGFDLSIVAGLKTPVGELAEQLTKLAGPHLASIDFVRQYEGSPLPAGQKSVSFHLEVGAYDHTLTSEEASAVREGIVQGIRQAGFEIRGVGQN